ncbi:glyoxylase-like metal-dependent hydrolase (beta-lactamase superfamily II) [Brevundimonas sp. SORGH_AS 993]|nr:glyoxylase-like metal-dependent hydrolase (beta-lactamase superfamily II) [Brevundimonas sp. SORGH_AS_0993]
MIPFVRAFDFAYGRCDRVSPLIQRVIAENPGPFTFTGTGTYIVGRPEAGATAAVIDPGPLSQAHLNALLDAVKGRTVSHILVTHTHRDHASLSLARSRKEPAQPSSPPDRRPPIPMLRARWTKMRMRSFVRMSC